MNPCALFCLPHMSLLMCNCSNSAAEIDLDEGLSDSERAARMLERERVKLMFYLKKAQKVMSHVR